MQTPIISVGIMHAKTIRFCLEGNYTCKQTDTIAIGNATVENNDNKIKFNGEQYDTLTFTPSTDKDTFSLYEVCIGIGFHWERKETQIFSGEINLIIDKGEIWVINKLPIEDYLFCVIASEMSATSSLELLKAHAVTSRSWLMAQLNKSNRLKNKKYKSTSLSDSMLIKWYDREDHTLFDVCADDHCQRYQGLTRATNNVVREAINSTRGEVIMYNGEICDARFSKCCGGITELFETCWEPEPHPYLQSFVDYDKDEINTNKTNLSNETDAKNWIQNAPKAFCNTNNKNILRQVLNSYDQETADFYRWEVSYTTQQLSEIIIRKTGINFGEITDIEAIERGPSGRIIKLRITGTKQTYIIGKELEIRRILSESHLYSSAFIIDHSTENTFTFRGAGWGHGVGLCQIGAAVMSYNGYEYRDIILHYFRNTTIEKQWD